MYNSIAAVIAFASLANASGVVHLPFERHARQAPADSLAKRSANAVTLPEEYNRYYYMAEIKVGTPAQTIKVEIDTSTRDIIFIDYGNVNCANFSDEYIPYGFPGYPSAENITCWIPTVFNSSNSSTYNVYLDDGEDIVDDSYWYYFLGRTRSEGSFGYDTIEIGGATLHNYTIGTQSYGNHSMSVLGLGQLIESDTYY